VSSTKQRKRRRRRRLVLFLVLGGIGYAVRRAQSGPSAPASQPTDLGAPSGHGPRPPARATSATPRPAAEKLDELLVETPAAHADPEPARAPADEPPYGPDSHAAREDGEQPEGFPIKGNADSMLYHVPGSSFYNRTVAEVWFRSAEAAEAAGFQLPPSQRDKKAETQPVAETIPGTEAAAPAKKAPAKKSVAAKKSPPKKTVAKKAPPAKKAAPPPPEQ
jgi:hypothetical protein